MTDLVFKERGVTVTYHAHPYQARFMARRCKLRGDTRGMYEWCTKARKVVHDSLQGLRNG